MPMRINRQLLLAKVETTFNTDAGPTAAADAILVENPDFQVDSVVLMRPFIKPVWSRTAHVIGRKLAKIKFSTEMKGGGTAGVQCKLGRLLTGCGFSENLIAAAVTGTAASATTTTITLAASASAVDNFYNGFVLNITGGTASGTNGGVITSYVGATKVATISAWTGTTPDATSIYSIGPGAAYNPSSNPANHKSLTLYLYKDGNLHTITGAFGNVQFDTQVNAFGKASFEFIGQYYPQTSVALPTAPVFEAQLPPEVQLSQFTIDGFAGTISKFTLDMGIKVLPRLDANGTDGYNGCFIDTRDLKGGIDPEAVLVASYDFWAKLTASTQVALNFRVGQTTGNTILITAPKVQYSGLTYAARDMLQTLDAALMFNQNTATGDDEINLLFT